MSIREQLSDYVRFKWFGLKTPTADSKLAGAAEDLCREIYNPGAEDIVFDNIHPMRARMWFHGKTPNYWMRLVCRPGEWIFLPHGMYTGTVKSGRPITVVVNFGDNMFIGNKHPSRPEASKLRSFVPGIKA